uniref:Uncharacterized protein n=1 Tax=Haemonchus contortus TaxID=6289 RepID=A0A7I4Z3M8_HAECO
MVDFVLRSSDGKQHHGQSCCYVTENLDIFGWEWIQKVPELVEPLQKHISGVTIVADPTPPCREETVAKLKVSHADVSKTGLGRCTKTKATLRLNPDAHPALRKKRPVPYAYVAPLDEEIDRLLAEQCFPRSTTLPGQPRSSSSRSQLEHYGSVPTFLLD